MIDRVLSNWPSNLSGDERLLERKILTNCQEQPNKLNERFSLNIHYTREKVFSTKSFDEAEKNKRNYPVELLYLISGPTTLPILRSL